MDESPTDLTPLVDESGKVPTRWEADDRGWLPHGRCVTYRPDGRLHVEITYAHGVAHGPYRDYWLNGGVSLEGEYRNGLQEGDWRFFNRDDGTLRETIRFVGGKEVMD